MKRNFRILKKPLNLDEMKKNKAKGQSARTRRAVSEIEKKGEDALGEIAISPSLEENYTKIEEVFKGCFDAVKRRFTIGNRQVKCFIVYLQELAGKDEISRNILEPLTAGATFINKEEALGPGDIMRIIKETILNSADIEELAAFGEAVKNVLAGNTVLFVDGCSSVISINSRQWKTRNVEFPRIEMTVRGPQESFVEDLNINTSLVRRRIKTPDLKMEKLEIGRLSKTDVVIAYIKGLAEEATVNEVRKRLNRIDIDMIIESGYIEHLIEDETYSPFPQTHVTERPDSCVGALAEGRIAILVDGSPFVLIVPAIFWDFLVAAEDYYSRFYFTSFMRILRHISFLMTLLLPSIYIAITTFHQEMIPAPLLINIARSRADVPFPAIIEAFLMEFVFEILREAGIRLPQPIGPAITIAGSIVIGQGAVEAGIVSQAMVIIVAITAIVSFVIPAFNVALSVRLLRFPFMIVAASLGIYGIIMGILALLVHMASLRSVGVPYLSPVAPLSTGDLRDTLIKLPTVLLRKRPSFIQRKNTVRQKEKSGPGQKGQEGGQ